MLDNKILYKRPADGKEVEGRLIKSFSHTNESYGQTKDIALIFYEDLISSTWSDGELLPRLVFKYVEIDDENLIITSDKSIYKGNSIYELIKKYGTIEYYIEDWLYNFVNYDGIKW